MWSFIRFLLKMYEFHFRITSAAFRRVKFNTGTYETNFVILTISMVSKI